jgi:hypothetical protein
VSTRFRSRHRKDQPPVHEDVTVLSPRHRLDVHREWDAQTALEASVPVMSDAVVERPGPEPRPGRVRPVPEDPFLELPAWPVLALLWGVPGFWILGLLPFECVVLAPVMLFYLTMRRHVWIAPGTFGFIALATWTSLGILVIEPGDVVGFTVRFVQYAAAAILVVYVVNAPYQLTRERLLSGLSAMFATIVAGGYLGMVDPYGHLTLTVGRLLPHGMRGNPFAQQLFFPQFAEVQTPYGATDAFLRPSAPFYFANGWGAAMTFLIPVVVAAGLSRPTRRARLLTLLGLLLAIPPAVAANNRGMLLALAIAVLVVVIRSAAQGHLQAAVLVVALTGVIAYLMLRLGLVQSVTERATAGQSLEGRGALYSETYQRTLQSPILGYGAPRASYSSEITVGTQGAIWEVMFCSGFVGLAFLVYFLVGAVVRTWRLRSVPDLWLNSALVATMVMAVYYGIDGILVPVMVLVGMLLRDSFLHSMQRSRAG